MGDGAHGDPEANAGSSGPAFQRGELMGNSGLRRMQQSRGLGDRRTHEKLLAALPKSRPGRLSCEHDSPEHLARLHFLMGRHCLGQRNGLVHNRFQLATGGGSE